ncbi:MAG: PEP-CTERM sorting domain-containing protein, partial [Methyloprofundus sp.]|nr:PEP-CTERM sorting domain-containing protein [Methyloprofundus sp.]
DFSAPVTTVLSFSGVPSAVPEPSILFLFMMGLVNLLLFCRPPWISRDNSGT